MSRKKKQDWKPATEYKVTKLPRNGPKPGQSVSSWEKGKAQEAQRFIKRRDTMNPKDVFPDL